MSPSIHPWRRVAMPAPAVTKSFTEHEAPEFSRRRTQDQANAELTASAADRVAEHTEQAAGRDDERKRAEEHTEHGHGARLRQFLPVERFEMAGRD